MVDLSNLRNIYFRVLIAIAILLIIYGSIFKISELYFASVGVILAVIVFWYLRNRSLKK